MALVEMARAEYIVLDPDGEVITTEHNRADVVIARHNYLYKEGITEQSERDLYKISTRYVFVRMEHLDLESEA